MTALAHDTLAENTFRRPLRAVAAGEPSNYSGVTLSPAVRLHAALAGIALAGLALIAATAIALLILTGPFHTSLGSIA